MTDRVTRIRSAAAMATLALALLGSGPACREAPEREKPMPPPAPSEAAAARSAAPPASPVPLLFIHHSCGGQLLADPGPRVGKDSIYETHPNGGGLRRLLQENRYVVHEASYGSRVGQDTDICHWNAKFREHMDAVLATRHQDERLAPGVRNRVVMFKSCYPNSWIDSYGPEPGRPDACEHTTANYQAAYRALLPSFEKHPDTLFVAVTAPPLAEPRGDRIKNLVKRMLGREDIPSKAGPRIRAFNNWLKDRQTGWLKDYPLNNVAVFDMYDVLTGHGQSHWSVYPTGDGTDSHPSAEGNRRVAAEFVPFLNAAVKQMGGVDP